MVRTLVPPPRQKAPLMPQLTIYGASDDLMEFDGAISEEFYVYQDPTEALLTAPNGERLTVTAQFGRKGWELAVSASEERGYPSWSIHFTERPEREGDPAIVIDVPEGTVVRNLSEPDDDE